MASMLPRPCVAGTRRLRWVAAARRPRRSSGWPPAQARRYPARTASGTGIDVRYDAVGSGKGIAALTERRVDFGATDVPLSPEELAKAEAAGGAVLHIPTVLGAITVVYHLPGSPRLRWTPN